MTANVQVGDELTTRMRLLGRQAHSTGVDLGLAQYMESINDAVHQFINTEVNTSLDTIRVKVARHQETTMDARSMAALVVEESAETKRRKEERMRDLNARMAATNEKARQRDDVLGHVRVLEERRARAALREKYEAFVGRIREKRLAAAERARQRALARLGSSVLGDSIPSTPTETESESEHPEEAMFSDEMDDARKNLLHALESAVVPPPVVDGAGSDDGQPYPGGARSHASDVVPPTETLLLEMQAQQRRWVRTREFLLGMEQDELPGSMATTASHIETMTQGTTKSRGAAEAHIQYARFMAAGGRAPRPERRKPSQLERHLRAIQESGVPVPRMCACPHDGVDTLDLNWTDGCCANCPLYGHRALYERLVLGWARASGKVNLVV